MIIEIPHKSINSIQLESIKRIIKRAGQAHFTDIHIRINGKWEKEEGDWIKHMKIIDPEVKG